MNVTVVATAALVLALVPALLYLSNLQHYRAPPARRGARVSLSVLIPARNEAKSIGPALEAVLASRGVDLEVIVLDDQSEDETRSIVDAFARRDERVRAHAAPPLPAGWCGKQHACHVLAGLAAHDVLVFLDADVRVEPDGLARMVAFLDRSGADLVSGVPRQITLSWLEKLVIPLIHFVLLGFLPMGWMKYSRRSAFAAGCGQLFVTRRAAYTRAGGHAAIRASLHDGITLPRAYRQAGLLTDVCDATPVAVCRMYRSAAELWFGLAKNAREGLAAPALLLPMTVFLLGGQVLPLALVACAPFIDAQTLVLAAAATALSYLPRIDAAWRFHQSVAGAVLHPMGVVFLVVIQWYATHRQLTGRPVGWKGRPHPVNNGSV